MRKLFIVLGLTGLMAVAFLAGRYFHSSTSADTTVSPLKTYEATGQDTNLATKGAASTVIVDHGNGTFTVVPPASSGSQPGRLLVAQNGAYSDTGYIDGGYPVGNASNYVEPNRPVAQPVVERRVVRRHAARHYYSKPKGRSWQRQALIIAGSAGAGTAIGALAGGKKGAGIGAVSGGVAGLVYNLATRNRNRTPRYDRYDE